MLETLSRPSLYVMYAHVETRCTKRQPCTVQEFVNPVRRVPDLDFGILHATKHEQRKVVGNVSAMEIEHSTCMYGS